MCKFVILPYTFLKYMKYNIQYKFNVGVYKYFLRSSSSNLSNEVFCFWPFFIKHILCTCLCETLFTAKQPAQVITNNGDLSCKT